MWNCGFSYCHGHVFSHGWGGICFFQFVLWLSQRRAPSLCVLGLMGIRAQCPNCSVWYQIPQVLPKKHRCALGTHMATAKEHCSTDQSQSCSNAVQWCRKALRVKKCAFLLVPAAGCLRRTLFSLEHLMAWIAVKTDGWLISTHPFH